MNDNGVCDYDKAKKNKEDKKGFGAIASRMKTDPVYAKLIFDEMRGMKDFSSGIYRLGRRADVIEYLEGLGSKRSKAD